MKKLLTSLVISTLLIASCGGGDEETSNTGDSDETYFFEYITSEFVIDVPEDWETITAFTSEYPDNIRVAFRSNIKDSDFIANVNIVREENPRSISNADFTQNKLSDHADTLVNYQLLSQEEVTMNVEGGTSATLLNNFQGKNSTTGPTLEYMQVNLTQGTRSWSITASYAPNEDSFTVERMEHMLKSFTLK